MVSVPFLCHPESVRGGGEVHEDDAQDRDRGHEKRGQGGLLLDERPVDVDHVVESDELHLRW
eukprot:15022682-Alexandrium_andersonii.AAC.1